MHPAGKPNTYFRIPANDVIQGKNALPGPSSANSYDAALIIIDSIKQVIAQGQQPTRAHMRDAIQHIDYTGVTGHISFDEHGDNSGDRVFSIYAVQNSQWVFVKSVVENS